jgi:type II secretory pathway pseudopilin PulG
MFCIHRQNGFTLLETVVAIGIILFGLLSIIALSTSSLIVSDVSSDEFLAANFAREAMEVVRSIRDTNWLAYDTDSTTAWNTDLSSGTDYTSIMNVATGLNLEFTPNAFGDSCTGSGAQVYDCTAIWFDPVTQVYIQSSQPTFNPSAYTQTAFSRLVYTYPLCRNTTRETDEVVVTSGVCTAGYTHVGIDVIVTVQWLGRNNNTTTYTLEEYLYDWKY